MPIEKEARTAEEAIEEICKELGKEKDELEFEIIEEKTRGIFGLMGNKRVKVRAQIKGEGRDEEKDKKSQDRGEKVRDRGQKTQEAGDDTLTYAKTVLERIVGGIIDSATVEGRVEGETIYLNIKGDGSGLLIGRHGQTLDAIQYIVGRIVGKQLGEKRMVVVDTERYRERRKENLEQLAQRMGEKAKSTGRPVSLQPMSASDRRIVHLALKNDREIETRSEGEGGLKNIKIIPRKRGS
jgi:spoIIIJ-associated protein